MKSTFLSLCLFASACGFGEEQPTVAPTGRVAGLILAHGTGQPMAAVDVAILTGQEALSTTTDGQGLFEINGVPAGSALWLDLAKDGFPRHRYQDILIDDAAGEHPQFNSIQLSEWELYPTAPDVRIHVTSSKKLEDGTDTVVDVAGVTVRAHSAAAADAAKAPTFPDELIATSGADGFAVLSGLAVGVPYLLRVNETTDAGTTIYGEGTFTFQPNAASPGDPSKFLREGTLSVTQLKE